MLHFFRKIRKSLIESGSAQRYLLYAIGEIVLVVFGILIALQINNRNERHKDLRLEEQYLISLKEEFLLNVEKLKVLDTLLGAQLEASNEFIQHMHPNKTNISDIRFSQLMGQGFRDTYNYVPSSGVIKDIINSGKLGLISNIELRRILADWDSQIIQLKEYEDESKSASYQVVELLSTQGNFRTQMNYAFEALGTGPSPFEDSNIALMNSELFENSVVYFSAVTWRLKNVFYPDLSNKMKDVISIIDTELK